MSDLIRRQDALACFHDWIDKHGDFHTADEITEYRMIEQLASAQPERKTGRWIYRKELSKYSDMWSCSECNEKTTDSIMGKPRPNFCPLCGADMRGEQDG